MHSPLSIWSEWYMIGWVSGWWSRSNWRPTIVVTCLRPPWIRDGNGIFRNELIDAKANLTFKRSSVSNFRTNSDFMSELSLVKAKNFDINSYTRTHKMIVVHHESSQIITSTQNNISFKGWSWKSLLYLCPLSLSPLLLRDGVKTLESMIFGAWGLGIRSRFGLVACSVVLPHTRLNLEVDIFTELLGVMDLMNLLCLWNDIMAEFRVRLIMKGRQGGMWSCNNSEWLQTGYWMMQVVRLLFRDENGISGICK